jgi:hypothetical protein
MAEDAAREMPNLPLGCAPARPSLRRAWQTLEKTIVRSRIRIQSRGQIIGAVISLVVLIAGIVFVATACRMFLTP